MYRSRICTRGCIWQIQILYIFIWQWGEVNWLFYVTGPTFLYGDSDTPPHLVAFYDHAGDTEVHILDLTARAFTGVGITRYGRGKDTCAGQLKQMMLVRLGYWFTPYQRPWLYNGVPLVAFYDTLGIRRTYSRLKPPASSRGYILVEVFFHIWHRRLRIMNHPR